MPIGQMPLRLYWVRKKERKGNYYEKKVNMFHSVFRLKLYLMIPQQISFRRFKDLKIPIYIYTCICYTFELETHN